MRPLIARAFFIICFALAGCATRETTPPAAPAVEPKAASPVPQPRTKLSPPDSAGWTNMFDGKTLRGWRESDFAGRGEVAVEGGKIVIGMGYMTGITWTNDIPTMNYEVELDAMRVEGSDFFCGLTFPVGKDPCSFIVGGWGGGVVGISSLDGQDASNNETAAYLNFEKGRWYKIRLRVLADKIQAWIDEDKVVDVTTTDRRISIRPEVEPSLPFGISTWSTSSALRKIRYRRL